MDHRKVTVTPDDLQKLKNLLREEEARVDAMESDEELAAAERELEERIRRLSRNSKAHTPPVTHIDENWQQIQKRLHAVPAQQEEEKGGGVVVPLRRKPAQWGWVGALAAAALTLFVLYPNMKNETQMTLDQSQLLTKGGSGSPAFSANCEVELRGKTNESSVATATGYEVTLGESFQVIFSCDKDGYVQVWNTGHPAVEYRNVPVRAGEKTGIIQDGKLAEFPLQSTDSWVFSVVLTGTEIGNEVDLLEIKELPETLGSSKVLWYDSISVKGKTQ